MFFLPAFRNGSPTSRGTDLNCDGSVNANDFTRFFVPKFRSNATPGPSGLACAGTVPCN
jgi:hypothetical protein